MDLEAPDVPQFLEQIVASGGHLWAWRRSANMNKLMKISTTKSRRISATDFIEKIDGARLLSI